MASVRKNTNGTYLVRVFSGEDSNGKKIIKAKTFRPSKVGLPAKKIQKELDAFIADFEEEVQNSGYDSPEKIRFDSFCEKYLEAKKPMLSPNTYPFYERVIRQHLVPMFGKIQMQNFKAYTAISSFISPTRRELKRITNTIPTAALSLCIQT